MPDCVIHLGDHTVDAEDLSHVFEKIPFITVPGNCDYDPVSPTERTVMLGGVTVFLTHGHLYSVKHGTQRLLLRAQQLQARIALFGHTHQAYQKEENGILLLNPGTASSCGRSSYALIEAAEGTYSCKIIDSIGKRGNV